MDWPPWFQLIQPKNMELPGKTGAAGSRGFLQAPNPAKESLDILTVLKYISLLPSMKLEVCTFFMDAFSRKTPRFDAIR
jgi:hypothetical protein